MAPPETHGKLYGIGVGPGDPELLTLKAHRLLQEADIIAFPCASKDRGIALGVVEPFLSSKQERLPLVYPVTADPINGSEEYEQLMTSFYDETAQLLATYLEQGKTIAIVCMGDPFLYGSYMYWHMRLKNRFKAIVVPGISSSLASAVQMGVPLALRDDILTLIPGTLDKSIIADRLRGSQASVIMKLGRTFPKVVEAITMAGQLERAYYVERATMEKQKIMPLQEAIDRGEKIPYFSLIVIPSDEYPLAGQVEG